MAKKKSKSAKKSTSKKKSTTKKTSTRKKPATKKKTTKAKSKKVTSKKSTKKKATTKKKSTTKKATSKKTSKAAAKKSTKKKSTKKSTTKGKNGTPAKTADGGEESGEIQPAKKVFKLVTPGGNGSRKGRTATTRPLLRYRPAKSAEELREPPTVQQLKKTKSGLSRKDLNYYKRMLLERRADILRDVDSLQNESLKDVEKEISYDHMADGGSDSFEQEFTLGLVESERRLLEKIYDALIRMREGYYGVCIETGKPIGKARLEIKPWARYCIEVAREKERRGEL